MRHAASILALLSCTTLVHAGDQPLLPQRGVQTAKLLTDLVAGDVDGDGREDIIAVSAAPSPAADVQVLRFGPHGELLASPSTSFSNTAGAATGGDFNNDGRQDLAVLMSNSRVYVLLAGAGGALAQPSSFTIGDDASDLVALDLDGDGWTDLVVLHEAGTTWTRLLNLGNGSFDVTPMSPTSVPNGTCLAAGDLDADGLADLVVTSPQKIYVAMGKSGSAFQLKSSAVQVGLHEPSILDMTGDGLPDVAASLQINLACLFPGDGDGHLGTPDFAPSNGNGRQVAVLDADGDGDDDLLVGSKGASLQLLPNTGVPAGFTTQLGLPAAVSAALVAVADVNGDGWRDAVTADAEDGWVTVLRAGPQALDVPLVAALPAGPISLQAADFTGDGHVELFSAGGAKGAVLTIAEGHGDGSFGPNFSTTLSLPAGYGMGQTVIASCDGDAKADVVAIAVSSEATQLQVLRCVGFATLVSGGTQDLDGQPIAGALAADLDGDGSLEVCVPATSGSIHVLRAAADGSLSPVGDVSVPGMLSAGVGNHRAVGGDIDEDGLLDMLFALPALDGVFVAIGQPDGSLGEPFKLPQPLLGTRASVALPDIDQDGLLDLVVGDDGAGLVVKHGLAGTVFSALQTIEQLEVCSLETGDLDDDGRVDVVALVSNDSGTVPGDRVLVHRGRPDGKLDVARGYTLPGDRMAVADVSFDGIPDVLTQVDGFGSIPDGSVSVAISRPYTLFVDQGHALAGVQGLPQLLAWGWLQPGQPLDLRLARSAPLAPALLVVGFSAVNQSFKSGTLVPSPDVILAGLATDADGRLALTGGWPSGVPSGVSLLLQAWIVDAAGPSGFAASNGVKALTP